MAKRPKKSEKKLTLKKKKIKDLPPNERSASAKGGAILSLGLPSTSLSLSGQVSLSPPYVPVGPVVRPLSNPDLIR